MAGAGSFMSGIANGYMAGSDIKDAKARREQRKAGNTSGQPAARGFLNSGAASAGGPSYAGKVGDRVSQAYRRFTDAGVPGYAAAGLTGNLMQESGVGINPAAVGDNGNAYGAAQWNGPRMKAYQSYADGLGKPRDDFNTQIDYILEEGRTTEKSAWDAIMATNNAGDAARVASEKFWRPGTPALERRMGYATSVYDRFANETSVAPALPQQGISQARGVEGLIDRGQALIDKFYPKKEG